MAETHLYMHIFKAPLPNDEVGLHLKYNNWSVGQLRFILALLTALNAMGEENGILGIG